MKTLSLTRSSRATIAGAVLLLGGVTTYASTSLRARPAARSLMHGFAAVPLAVDAMRENEKAFLSKAAETSRQQMRLAEVGASQAGASEVRSHAMTLAADYRALGESLEALTRRKGGIAGAPVGGTSETYQSLAQKAGSDFDREFIRTVAALSNDVMTLFETAAADAKDADVRDFAAAQLSTLRAHRNTVAELKKLYD